MLVVQDRTGLYTCPHTAVALAATEKLIKKGEIKATDKVVVVSTAHGLKFTEFKTRYHDGQIEGVNSRQANPPVFLPPDLGQVVDAISRRFPA